MEHRADAITVFQMRPRGHFADLGAEIVDAALCASEDARAWER
jgi:hypothetical protein